MSEWNVVGQIGGINECDGGTFKVDIAINRYEYIPSKGRKEKRETVWLNCICRFEPNCKVGDKVIARGVFVPSKNNAFPFALEIRNIGVIKSAEAKTNGGVEVV